MLAWCLVALTAAIVTAGGAARAMAQIGVLSAIYVAVTALAVRRCWPT